MPEPLRWTREAPTVPGFYWHQGPATDGRTEPVEVTDDRDPRGLAVSFIGSDFPYTARSLPGEWYGPVSPPPPEGV